MPFQYRKPAAPESDEDSGAFSASHSQKPFTRSRGEEKTDLSLTTLSQALVFGLLTTLSLTSL
jgi:hypothetical protein